MTTETASEETREPAAAQAASAPARLDQATARSIIMGIMLAMFLSALEQTIVAPALPAIGKSLGALDDLSWVVTAYLLAATATTPLFGKLSDIYGRRAMLLTAIGIFLVGSVACALAPNMPLLMLARGLQGIGGGGLLPIAQTIIGDLLTPRERTMIQGRITATFMIASILGPTLGGFLTEHVDWSLIFWINLPLGALALLMSARALRQLPRHERRHRLDMLGALLLVAAALSLMLALSWGGTHYPWRSWQIVGLFAASLLLWALFVVRLLTAREPFIPLAVLGGRTTGAVTLAAFFSVGTIIGITIYTPLYCETVLGLSASRAGMTLISFMAGTVAGAQINMRLMLTMVVKHYLRLPLACLGVAIATLVTLAMLPTTPSAAAFVGVLFVIGFAVGPMYPVSTILMQNSVKPHQLGTATGTLNFFRTLGGAIIVAVFGAIVLGVAANASQTTIEELALSHGDMVPAFHFVFLTAALFLAISFVALLFAEEHPLHGPVPLSPED